jgi:hypothetical protein
MKKRFLFAIATAMIATAAATVVHAQRPIEGHVYNAETGEILPYVTVAVKGRNIGVISDREGRFEIRGDKGLSAADSVVFSHIGFITETRTVGQLTGGGNPCRISLQQGKYEIEQIVVTNRKSRLARLGHSSGGTGMVLAGWFDGFSDSLSSSYRVNREGGVPVKIAHDSDILSFGMLIRQNGYDRALLRLSFYELDGKTPGELIVHKDIRFEVKDRHKGRFEVDLSPYGIRFAGGREILVTLTLLEDEMDSEKPEAFMLDAAFLGRGVYDRVVGSETWDRVGGFTMTMYLNARVYK